MLLDFFIVEYLLDLSVAVENQTKIVLDAAVLLVGHFYCSIRYCVNTILLENWIELVNSIFKHGRLDLASV